MSINPSVEALPPAPARVSGIGGWLILPMLGLIGAPIVQLIGLPALLDGISNLDGFSAAQSGLIYGEVVLSLLLFLVAPIWLLVQLYRKRRTFPGSYIFWTIAAAIYVVLDLVASYALFSEILEASGVPFFDRDTLRALGGAAVGICIWVPYMMNSVRVRNTFVN